MLVPTPPPRQLALLLVIDRFRIRVPPWVGLVALAVLVPSGAWMALGDSKPPPPSPPPIDGALPLQQWAAAVDVPRFVGAAYRGALPAPDPRQRKPPCATKIGEEEINGFCWLRLDILPPCPKDPDAYAYEHGGKCYGRALRAARVPTTGEIPPGNVAGGAE